MALWRIPYSHAKHFRVGAWSATPALCARTSARAATTASDPSDRTLSKSGKQRVVILGTGWAAFRMIRSLNTSLYDITRSQVVSPRNHFLFTPLLPETASGTIDFRSIIEPIRSSKAMQHIQYYQAKARHLDTDTQQLTCRGELDDRTFTVDYDKLVIAVGASCNTFGIPGVKEHAMFLKELGDARRVRERLINCFELANMPSTPKEERQRLLSFVIVGGGPTGVEFAGELADFFWQDLHKAFPHAPLSMVKITLVEASDTILSAFDKKLVTGALKSIKKQGIELRMDSIVSEVRDSEVLLKNGERIPFGLLVWSTGVGPRRFTASSDLPKTPRESRFIVNDFLQVKGYDNIYALGDCAQIADNPLPATAQVAQQQGAYLGEHFNALVEGKRANKGFEYNFIGLMTYVGGYKSLIDSPWLKSSGIATWIAWRSAYLTKLGSLKNKLQVPFDWFRTFVFGRDVTNF